MASRYPSNVVPFEAPVSTPSRPTAPDASDLLLGCRDRLCQGVVIAFAENLGQASNDLLGMADRATSLEQQQLYFAAMDFLAKRGQSMLQHFRGAFVAQFDQSIGALRQGHGPRSSDELVELRLIDTDDFERDLAVGKLSARAACNCANQLTALDRRLAALLRVARIGQDDNPLHPRALFSSLLQAFRDMEVGDELALALLQEFERQTSVELPRIYNDLNRHLADCGVLPTIPVSRPRPAQRSPAGMDAELEYPARSNPGLAEMDVMDPGRHYGADPAPAPAGASPARGASAGPDVALGTDADDVFARLAQAIQAAGAPAVAAPQGIPAASRAAAGTPSLVGAAQLVEALTSIQRGHVDTSQLPGLGSVQLDPTGGGVLQQLRATPMANWSHPVDAMTIDIVAMLFDAIFNDPDLPATLRAEIAKLQIPVLKVALMDKAFFSNKRHPARRLLDVIASAGIGRGEADEPRMVSKIRSIVDAVVAGFETDTGIFAAQVQKLEDFLQDEESRARTRTDLVVTKLERHDRAQVARQEVTREIDQRLHSQSVPTVVAEFLQRHWRLVLIQSFAGPGDSSGRWEAAIRTMDDLLWSVSPKQGSEERTRLLANLPDLLQRLRNGLESVDLGDAWDPFFARLIRIHVAALHQETPQDTYVPPSSHASPPATPAEPSMQTLAMAKPSLGIADRAPTPPATVNGAEGPADRHLERARSIDVGAWVEFEGQRGTKKTLRLSWVSEFRGVYLFTNRQGENSLTLATTSLADHLRKGTARVLSQDRLTDRAVTRLLKGRRGAAFPDDARGAEPRVTIDHEPS